MCPTSSGRIDSGPHAQLKQLKHFPMLSAKLQKQLPRRPGSTAGIYRRFAMVNSLKTAVLASLIGLTLQAASPAQAGVLADRFGVLLQKAASGGQQRCTPEAALQKAKRIGIRQASVVYVRFSSIGVTGQLNGNRIDVKFSREPNCPVLHLD
jgi:hypothetical protein